MYQRLWIEELKRIAPKELKGVDVFTLYKGLAPTEQVRIDKLVY